MRNIISIAVLLVFALVLSFGFVQMNPTPYHSYIQSLESDDVITDEQAMLLCDDLGLVYDYEATGYTVADFCYEPLETLSMED